MKTLIVKLLALGGVILLVWGLSFVFLEAETSLRFIFVVLSAAGIGIAALALFSKKRWLFWAALGVWPGALIGGLIFGGIAFLTISDDTTGWEGVIVIIVAILGIFVGAVAGAITGGVLGARKTRRAQF
jgi:hypothetical protein